MKKKITWKDLGNNSILEAEWGRISYNPNTSSNLMAPVFTSLVNSLGGNKGVKIKDGEETALYDGKTWRILTGDFRKEYEKVFPNLNKSLAIYKKNIKYRNGYSTD